MADSRTNALRIRLPHPCRSKEIEAKGGLYECAGSLVAKAHTRE